MSSQLAGGKLDSLLIHLANIYLAATVCQTCRDTRSNNVDEQSALHGEFTSLETFLGEVGLELYPEGRTALIGTEKTSHGEQQV